LLTLVTVDTDWLVVVLLPLMMMAMLVLLMLPLRIAILQYNEWWWSFCWAACRWLLL
jgi:hypothetical protein